MRVHHLNCVSSCPLGGRLMDGGVRSALRRGHLTNHCLLIEDGSGLVLVDTGLGLRDVADPRSRLSWFFLSLVSPDFREEMTARRQVEALGFDANDVRHIVLTHLDFDHAGGLDDFPRARIHMMQSERDYAIRQRTWLDRQRFRREQWDSQGRWEYYLEDEGEKWLGFGRVHALSGISQDVVMIPLPGHTFGHAGVAVRAENRWLFLAGDAYFFRAEMRPEHPWCTPGLRFYQAMMEKDRGLRLRNQERLRELKRDRSGEVEVFCSHDAREFERLSGRSAETPPAGLVRAA